MLVHYETNKEGHPHGKTIKREPSPGLGSIESNASLMKVILGWATRLFGVFEKKIPKCE